MGKKPITEEEYTTNKVLTVFSVCLLGVLVLMILQRLLNYGNTFMIGLIVTKILLAIGIIGVIGGLVMLGMERSGRRNSARRIVCGRNLLIASVVMTLCMSAISYVGTAPIKALYVILPVLAVFYLVYHSYSTEFFVITVDSGAALGLMCARFFELCLGGLRGAHRGCRSDHRADFRGQFGPRKAGQVEEHRQEGGSTLQQQCFPHDDGDSDYHDRADRSRSVRAGAYAGGNGYRSGVPVRDRGLLHRKTHVI